MEDVPLDLSVVKKTEDPALCPLDLSGPLDLSIPKENCKVEKVQVKEPPSKSVIPSERHTNLQETHNNECSELLSTIAHILRTPESALNPRLKRSLTSIWDWTFVPIANPDPATRIIVIGVGGAQLLRFDPLQSGGLFKPLTEVPGLELPGYTILYAELVYEHQQDEDGSQHTRHRTLHVIDGFMLDNVDISRLPLHRRYARCKQFVGIFGSSKMGRLMHMKPLYELRHLRSFFADTKEFRLGPERQKRPGCTVSSVPPVRFYVPHGLLLLRDTKQAVHRHLSKSSRRFYFFDASTKHSWFPAQPAMATFVETFGMRTVWTWDFEESDNESEATGSIEKVVRHEILAYIQSQLQPTSSQ